MDATTGGAPGPYTPAAAVLTDIVLEVFRLNGLLVAFGDRLTADLGLTSARWKVMGAVAVEGRPLTVAQAARRMGLTRQAVQRVADELAGAGILEALPNPDHRRAPLFALTPRGRAAYDEVTARYAERAEALTEGLDPAGTAAALQTLRALSARLGG